MSTFAPVFAGTQSGNFAQRQREHKRRRLHKDAGRDDSDDSDTKKHLYRVAGASSTFHPVKKTDPYHVAGHPREADLPPSPFPHAPVARDEAAVLDLNAELAKLNPPLILQRGTAEEKASHLKRSHAGNMTTIMHASMLDGDWNRASRAWGLLLRTEIGGKGPALRQHGSWSVGAELLMRRDSCDSGSSFEDDGIHLVRRYYERLVLQYPKTARSKSKVTALSIYPAMFNVWIYGVHRQSKQAQESLEGGRARTPSSVEEASFDVQADEGVRTLLEIKAKEAKGAATIIQRMDDLMSGPPYDDSGQLLLLRGMCGLWLTDLQEQVSQSSSYTDAFDQTDPSLFAEQRSKARDVLRKAQYIIRKQEGRMDVLPSSIQQMLDNWHDLGVL